MVGVGCWAHEIKTNGVGMLKQWDVRTVPMGFQLGILDRVFIKLKTKHWNIEIFMGVALANLS